MNSIRTDSEANLQGEFYHACRILNMQVALEVETPAGRLDAVVLNHDRTAFLAIVEVKSSPIFFQAGHAPQILRYKQLGVPVYGLSPANDAHKLAATIRLRHSEEPGVQLSAVADKSHLRTSRLAAKAERRFDRLRERLNVKS